MPLSGILNVNKPPGCSSRHAVDRIERLVRPAKAGHAGTLDPLAFGVLVICVGQATRLIGYVQQMRKQYRAQFLLGHYSETDDTEGEVTPTTDAPIPTRGAIDDALPKFLGEIQQVPPLHSAVKIAGRRAYKLARAGKPFELLPRPVTIHCLNVVRYEYPELEIEIDCGSGTYVRSLGRDLAQSLGTSAVMSALERTAIGAFHLGDALALDDVSPETIAQRIQPPLAALPDMPRIILSEAHIADVLNGRPVPKTSIALTSDHYDAPEYAATDSENRLVAIVREKSAGQLWPSINFA